jgi:hypothetical protein
MNYLVDSKDGQLNISDRNIPDLSSMLQTIEQIAPKLAKSRVNFGKTQSQFMDNMLTVSCPTPLRNLHQILAEIEQVRGALRYAGFNLQKKQIEHKIKLRDIQQERDELKKELMQIELKENEAEIVDKEIYIAASIRKLTNYSIQFESISKKIMKDQGIEDFSELDFEKAEEKYHIMRAFEQGLCSARSHGGIIDEGNQIYLYQIGINGAVAQAEVLSYLSAEAKAIEAGKNVDHSAALGFLEAMADKFAGCSKKFADYKGMIALNDSATFKKNDM